MADNRKEAEALLAAMAAWAATLEFQAQWTQVNGPPLFALVEEGPDTAIWRLSIDITFTRTPPGERVVPPEATATAVVDAVEDAIRHERLRPDGC